MPNLDHFQRWAQRARDENPPQPDVAGAVMRRLRQMEAPRPETGPWMWAASAASVCASVACAALGYAAWVELSAPWQGWIQELSDWGVL